jgi:putative redox protein
MYRVSVELGRQHYQTRVTAGKHVLIADEPPASGGGDEGADPFELLLASVGSCTAITLRMYADRKGWPLEHIHMELTLEVDKERSVTNITKLISLDGPLTPEQNRRLMQIADKCPTHKVLTGTIRIASKLAGKAE